MNAILKTLLLCILLMRSIYVFSQEEMEGTYSYMFTKGTYSFRETITLYPDGQFIYNQIGMMGNECKIYGNWQKRNTYLILDSHPQRDKIIVRESFQGKRNGVNFHVEDKEGNKIMYHLYVILQNGDNLVLKDQYDETTIYDKVKSFWIKDTKGLKSPIKTISSNVANVINVIFETKRVFENEKWNIIDKEKLNPKGTSGELQNYYLIRE